MGRSRRGIAALVGILAASTAAAPVATAQPDDPSKWIVDRPKFEPIDPTHLTADGIGDYRGGIELVRNGKTIDVVNHVTVEDYLKGISEVPAAWPLEAQKAQAIAARTYALYEAARKSDSDESKTTKSTADLCATDSCQVYAGLAKERRQGSEAWLAAVAQTKHQVLLHETGRSTPSTRAATAARPSPAASPTSAAASPIPTTPAAPSTAGAPPTPSTTSPGSPASPPSPSP